MSHLLSETARAAYCVFWCNYLMSLKHPEMLELSGKRFSVSSTEIYERQCRCQEARLPTNHCKTESACCILFFGDYVTEVGSNTATLVSGVGIPPRRP